MTKLMSFLTTMDFFPIVMQSGFRRFHSTATALS
jgi:hypothetical protein